MAVLGATLAATAGPAAAEAVWPQAGCEAFTHVQTYRDWGPARFYGYTVTVLYEATGCSTLSADLVELSMEGTATAFRGSTASGAPVDTRPFSVSGSWRSPGPATAWSPSWWGCQVEAADYAWRISGVYTFDVAAREGRWTLDVVVGGRQPQSVHWAHNACA